MTDAGRDSPSLLARLTREAEAALSDWDSIQELELAPEWSEREGEVGGERAVMRSRAWSSEKLAWLRLALLDGGERSRVFSMLAIPRPSFDLPLFGAEVVEIRAVPTVVALDWIPVAPDSPYTDGLEPIRQSHAHFPPGGDLPPWAAQSFSPHALFSRPREAVSPGEIVAAFGDYFRAYLEMVNGSQAAGEPETTLQAQQAYCTAHFENDPGGRMLAKLFGEEWSAAYAEEFLFRIPAIRP